MHVECESGGHRKKPGNETTVKPVPTTVQRTQPGPPKVDQPITSHIDNKEVWLW